MINYRKENDEVLYPQGDVLVDTSDLTELKRLARLNPRQRVRLCTHDSPADSLHEMFIVHARDCYVRPHCHIGKSESMSVLEGEVDVVLFNAEGSVTKIVQMGPPGSGKAFYHRLSEGVFHTLLIRSEFLVFQETTEGPFLRERTVFPDWAPMEQDAAASDFVARLKSLQP